jgi:hypothetical protein
VRSITRAPAFGTQANHRVEEIAYMREIFFSEAACSWQKQRHANRVGRRTCALALNSVFTRVVNHCVTVVGHQGARRPAGTVGQSLLNRLRPNLNVEHEMTLGKKTTPVQYLRAIRLSCP